MTDTRPDTLWGSIRKHWRWYLPAWLFPLVLYFSVLLMPKDGRTNWVWYLVDLPLFFLSFFLAAVPRFRGQERHSHSAILGMVIPFLTWGVLVFTPFLLIRVLGTILGVS